MIRKVSDLPVPFRRLRPALRLADSFVRKRLGFEYSASSISHRNCTLDFWPLASALRLPPLTWPAVTPCGALRALLSRKVSGLAYSIWRRTRSPACAFLRMTVRVEREAYSLPVFDSAALHTVKFAAPYKLIRKVLASRFNLVRTIISFRIHVNEIRKTWLCKSVDAC